MIRVLVVDDSPTARALITGILGLDPEVEIVGEAVDGLDAVKKAAALKPDVMTLDLLMPRMDGLAATREIMTTTPLPIVIVSSTVSEYGEGEVAMQALRAGAVHVLRKPGGPTVLGHEEEAEQFVSAVKAMAGVKVVRRWREAPGVPAARRQVATLAGGRPNVIAIAASTGGPGALQTLLTGLGANFPVPLLVVQHITKGFTQSLATWLSASGPMTVKIADAHEIAQPGTVYLAPDDHHLGITKLGRIALSDGPPIGGFRPSANHLFESVAHAQGQNALGIILTGMGTDGVEGLRTLRDAGGRVVAQDEPSSVVFGMPRAAIAEGLAHIVTPLESLAAQLKLLF